MVQQYYRALKLLDVLQANNRCSGEFLCAQMGVQPRMLRRLVTSLRELGYPVQSTQGKGGGYWLGSGAKLPPILLDDAEAIAVVAGLHSRSAGSIEGINEGANRAMLKIERMLPTRLGKQIAAMRESTLSMKETGPTVSHGALTSIGSACSARRAMQFSYIRHNGDETQRTVEPFKMVQNGYLWYLVAWDQKRNDWRTFRVDRISNINILSSTFPPREPPSEDIARQTSWSVSNAAYQFRGQITIHAPLEEVLPRVASGVGILERIDASNCRLETGATTLTILAIYLLEIGFPFTIEGPEALKEEAARAGMILVNSVKNN